MSKKSVNIFLIFCVSIGGSLYGYNIGAMSGVLLFIKNTLATSETAVSIFVAAFLCGVAIIMPIAALLSDKLGRKKLLIIAAFLSIFGIVSLLLSESIIELTIGRLITGLSSGMIIMITPIYIAETIPADLRGRATVCFQLFISLGILLATTISFAFNRTNNWKAVFGFELIPAVALALISTMVAESPRWLITKNKTIQAIKSLQKVFSSEQATTMANEIRESIDSTKELSIVKIFSSKQFYLPVIFVLAIGVLNQMTGINVILQYDSVILTSAGISSHYFALVGSIVVTALNFVITVVAILIVDRIERKTFLRFGLIGIVLCLSILAGSNLFITSAHIKNIINIASLLGFIFFFAISPGALVWALLSEVLPSRIRGAGISIALLLSSLTGAALSAAFLPMQREIGLGGIFLLCAISTIFYLILSFYLPKTSRRSLETIEKDVLGRSTRSQQ